VVVIAGLLGGELAKINGEGLAGHIELFE